MKSVTIRPLWRLLLFLKSGKSGRKLTCDECFRLLEYLAYIRAHDAVTETRFLSLINQHLAVCPGCQEQYARMLDQMELTLNSDKDFS